jgi:hypothetical protein
MNKERFTVSKENSVAGVHTCASNLFSAREHERRASGRRVGLPRKRHPIEGRLRTCVPRCERELGHCGRLGRLVIGAARRRPSAAAGWILD